MDAEIDLRTADRDVLIGIVRQQAITGQLEKRVANLEGPDKSGVSGRMLGQMSSAAGTIRPRSHPEAPAYNNAAERSSRPPVVSRKVNGATHIRELKPR